MTIAGIWRAITLAEEADRYLEQLNQTVIPAYRTAEGNEGLFVMRECQGEFMHFLLLSFWSSKEALISFTDVNSPEGRDLTIDAKKLLVAFESTPRCYKVVCVSKIRV